MKWSKFSSILVVLWGLMLCSLLLNRTVSSVILVVLGVTAILGQFIKDKPKITWSAKGLGIFLMLLLFLIYSIGYLRFMDHPKAWSLFQKKSALLIIPLIWTLSRLDWKDIKTRIYLWLSAGIIMGGTIMLVGSAIAFIDTGDWNEFFYHAFTKHVPISAIYYSLFIVITLAIPIDESKIPFSKRNHNILRVALVLLLLISASKLFVFLGLLILTAQFLHDGKKITIGWKQIMVLVIGGFLTIPVIIRTSSLMNSNMEIVSQEEYRYDTPVNGLTLRLIQSRFGFEILDQENAWLVGVGPALSKAKLDNKYRQYKMYTGDPKIGDRGMLAYNYHNQWVETLVGTGLPGLAALVLIFGSLLWFANFRKLDTSLIIVFAIFMFTESFLERQQGIVLFAFVASIIFKPDSIE